MMDAHQLLPGGPGTFGRPWWRDLAWLLAAYGDGPRAGKVVMSRHATWNCFLAVRKIPNESFFPFLMVITFGTMLQRLRSEATLEEKVVLQSVRGPRQIGQIGRSTGFWRNFTNRKRWIWINLYQMVRIPFIRRSSLAVNVLFESFCFWTQHSVNSSCFRRAVFLGLVPLGLTVDRLSFFASKPKQMECNRLLPQKILPRMWAAL